MKTESIRKGFTLIELLVVIAILAILATVIVVIINPGELMKQARDTTRISDFAAINSAIALYLSDYTSANLGASTSTRCTANITTTPTGWGACTVSTSTAVSGTGWINADFTQISSGSPLARLPMDPVNDLTYAYGYRVSGGANQYKLAARMESTKYKAGGTADVTSNSKDGGTDAAFYEIGNNMSL